MKTIRDALGGVHRADAVVSVVPECDDDGATMRAAVGIVLTNGHAYTIWKDRGDREYIGAALQEVLGVVYELLGWEP